MTIDRVVPFIPVLLLFGAFFEGLPYVYFQILRWSVCISAILWAWDALGKNMKVTIGVFCTIAVLFNPIAPIYLSRETWVIIDGAVGGIFLIRAIASIRSCGRQHKKADE